jgi:hypothetical protein
MNAGNERLGYLKATWAGDLAGYNVFQTFMTIPFSGT